MAKPSGKTSKSDAPLETASSELSPVAQDSSSMSEASSHGEALPRNESTTKAESGTAPQAAKKEVAKLKKPLLPKTSSLLPSPQKLDHLKAAVLAAGTTDNLIAILQHVDEAGGRKEVLESIEAYRVLKTVLEES
jgi:hypothetical protein